MSSALARIAPAGTAAAGRSAPRNLGAAFAVEDACDAGCQQHRPAGAMAQKRCPDRGMRTERMVPGDAAAGPWMRRGPDEDHARYVLRMIERSRERQSARPRMRDEDAGKRPDAAEAREDQPRLPARIGIGPATGPRAPAVSRPIDGDHATVARQSREEIEAHVAGVSGRAMDEDGRQPRVTRPGGLRSIRCNLPPGTAPSRPSAGRSPRSPRRP